MFSDFLWHLNEGVVNLLNQCLDWFTNYVPLSINDYQGIRISAQEVP